MWTLQIRSTASRFHVCLNSEGHTASGFRCNVFLKTLSKQLTDPCQARIAKQGSVEPCSFNVDSVDFVDFVDFDYE